MSRDASLTLQLHGAIADIQEAEWDACAGTGNPFLSHAFLSALEDSGSVGGHTGWLPQHAALRDSNRLLVAVIPLYGKAHSYGEYVFDHSWAHALEQAGGHYYPKLQVAVPFSPVTGARLLRHPDCDLPVADMAQALQNICAQFRFSSVHVTFCEKAEWQDLGECGWLQRTGLQFHWLNENYRDFEDFLAKLASRKRKAVRRERRDANAAGLSFQTLRGSDIKPHHWDAFYRFYTDTVDRKWGSAYLTRDFFTLLSERLRDSVLLMLAYDEGAAVAGALNLIGADALYGRNWGTTGNYPFLHFELCYYRAIDFAIENRLARIEAGAQGEHKIQRGYLPSFTYSAHWIAHRGLRRAVASFLQEERAAIIAEADMLTAQSPFRQAEGR